MVLLAIQPVALFSKKTKKKNKKKKKEKFIF